jgi:hypothetical protein
VTPAEARAMEHAPQTLEEARVAALNMSSDGHGIATIATALRMPVEQIRSLLAMSCDGCGD